MKVLKLIAIAIVVLAAVVGLLFLSGGSGSTTITGDKGRLMEKMKGELLTEWNASQEWDTDLFDNSLDRLKQNRRELGDGYQTLVDLTGELACHRLDSVMMAEWAKSDCDHTQIEVYGNALDHLLAKISHFNSNADVNKMKATMDLYRKARSLSSRNLSLAPRFNAETDQWTSFASHSSAIKRQCSDIKQSPYWANISNITEITSGLAQIDSRLQAAKGAYKTRLAREIIAAYEPLEPHETDRLAQVHSRFLRELGGDNDLNKFVQNY
ncbi:MAG: hypothetical protein IJ544_01030 [Prevotella sp.]|nr:hypothetical protein [Prevotella sp.]